MPRSHLQVARTGDAQRESRGGAEIPNTKRRAGSEQRTTSPDVDDATFPMMRSLSAFIKQSSTGLFIFTATACAPHWQEDLLCSVWSGLVWSGLVYALLRSPVLYSPVL